MKMKQNQTFSQEIYLNLKSYIYLLKNSKVFQWPSNKNASILWLRWTQTMEMKQNQTFFHEEYTNLTSFSIGDKILKYFNDFCNWNRSISVQK